MKPSIQKLSFLAALAVAPAMVACSTTQPVTQGVDDSGTTARVKAQIAADPDLRSYEIDSDTVDGVVYLHGEVDTQSEKKQAEQIASNTRGVRRVVNQLQVKQAGEGSDVGGPDWDAWITAKVKSRLSVNPEVRAFNIDVDTQDGVVYLTGVVNEEIDRQEAVQLARDVEGVDKIVNNLKIESETREGKQEQKRGAAMEAQGPEEHAQEERAQERQEKQLKKEEKRLEKQQDKRKQQQQQNQDSPN